MLHITSEVKFTDIVPEGSDSGVVNAVIVKFRRRRCKQHRRNGTSSDFYSTLSTPVL